MTDDLVKRLRDGCSCDIDSSPCMAEEECRDAYAAADRIEALEAKLAKAVGLLEAWVNVAAHCTIEEGVCCCGFDMASHGNPLDHNHMPVDHGAYVARGLVKETNATLSELTRGEDD